MAKRTFLQLCHKYNADRYRINGWMVSHKLDGMRAFWDGGLSRGVQARDVPWANVEKDDRLIEGATATGLWSRLGKVIHAPDWFLDQLPHLPLDGELYLGPRMFQKVMSICKTFTGLNWNGVQYCVFDSPPLDEVFANGDIDIRIGNQKYVKNFSGIMEWIEQHNKGRHKIKTVNNNVDFEHVINLLNKTISPDNHVVKVIEQKRLPFSTPQIDDKLKEYFDEAMEAGVEGVVIRAHFERWRPERAHYMLKHKPFLDSEGIVKDYTFGREGKLLGMMGALVVDWKGKTFEISGFTDSERQLENAVEFPAGKLAPAEVNNPKFPRGSVVTFRYRELSDQGIPKEGRYLRLRNE